MGWLLALGLGACEGDTITRESAADSLVDMQTEPAGTNCEYGGQIVLSGPDANGNGTLDDDEITATDYVCADPPPPVSSA